MLFPSTACKRSWRGTFPFLLMHRWLRPLGLVAAILLVGYAGSILLADPEADEAVDDAIADAQASDDDVVSQARARAGERMRRAGRQLAMSPDGTRPDDDGGPAGVGAGVGESVPSDAYYGSGEIDPTNAREGFAYAMGRVEAVAKSRRRLTQEEWDALYREANDAFAALSVVVDGHDDAQLAELEVAHKRLKQGLGKVRVRGEKLAD